MQSTIETQMKGLSLKKTTLNIVANPEEQNELKNVLNYDVCSVTVLNQLIHIESIEGIRFNYAIEQYNATIPLLMLSPSFRYKLQNRNLFVIFSRDQRLR